MGMFNQDFYPTPRALIARMLNGVRLHEAKSILEPSAGKGDIADFLNERARRSKVDCIEIERDLQSVLSSKGHNLVHDDFLTFRTFRRYDLIVANFPFSDGDRHLRKALSMLEERGGSLVCLVNAETIRNPFSSLRKSVVASLEAVGASVEYLSGEFSDAERPTGVEVALVRASAKAPPTFSVILDGLKEASRSQVHEPVSWGVVDSDPIKAMAARFRAECEMGSRLIQEHFALKPLILESIPENGQGSFYQRPLIGLEVKGAAEFDGLNETVNAYLSGVRRKYWKALIGNSWFRNRYTSNVLSELREKLDALESRDFTEFNVSRLEDELISRLKEGVEAAMLRMFDEFSGKFSYHDDFGKNVHYYDGWKTNRACRINGKVILPVNGFSSYSWKRDELDPRYVMERLVDMVKVFNYLSGDLGEEGADIMSKISEANSSGSFRNLEFKYFLVSFFRKGTCHIVFRDKRLLDKLNIFGSQRRGWLPPGYGRKSWEDMDGEERSSVEAFQGEEAYHAVMAHREFYVVETPKFLIG